MAERGVAGGEQNCERTRTREPAQLGQPFALSLELEPVAPVELVASLRRVPVPATKFLA
jgi:hypothetical protein